MTSAEPQASRMRDDMEDMENRQEQRLETIKELVHRSAYRVPSEEVAARIIRRAFGLQAPSDSGST